jgi:squalene cyclase
VSDLYGKRIRDELEDVLDHQTGWARIHELVAALDDRDAWGDFLDRAVGEAKKALVRRLVREIRDPDGVRRVASVEVRTEAGDVERVYKQETLFDVKDYEQVCQYHLGKHQYHWREAQGYACRCQARYGVDPLPDLG